MERAVRTLTAQFYITARIVFVMKDSLAIHSVVAVKSFYVSKIFGEFLKYKKKQWKQATDLLKQFSHKT